MNSHQRRTRRSIERRYRAYLDALGTVRGIAGISYDSMNEGAAMLAARLTS